MKVNFDAEADQELHDWVLSTVLKPLVSRAVAKSTLKSKRAANITAEARSRSASLSVTAKQQQVVPKLPVKLPGKRPKAPKHGQPKHDGWVQPKLSFYVKQRSASLGRAHDSNESFDNDNKANGLS